MLCIVETTKVLNFCRIAIRQPINIIFAIVENIQRVVSFTKFAVFVNNMCEVIVL